MKTNKTEYERHLESMVAYWQQISAAEREKNIKLEEVIKKIEQNIYGLNNEEDK